MTQSFPSWPTSLKAVNPARFARSSYSPLDRTLPFEQDNCMKKICPWVWRSLWGLEFPRAWAFPRWSTSPSRHLAMRRGSPWGLSNNARHPNHARSSAYNHTYRLIDHKLLSTNWLLGLNYEGMWRDDDLSIQQFEGFLALPWSRAINFIGIFWPSIVLNECVHMSGWTSPT